jgi:hypothetical protein
MHVQSFAFNWPLRHISSMRAIGNNLSVFPTHTSILGDDCILTQIVRPEDIYLYLCSIGLLNSTLPHMFT